MPAILTGLCLCMIPAPNVLRAGESQTLSAGQSRASITLEREGDTRSYVLKTNADLRDDTPSDKRIAFSESTGHATTRTGNLLFDGLYAMATAEALANSVPQISDTAYGDDTPIEIEAFQTGELWKYVWTRDLAYSLHLSLAGFDPERAVNSLLFKSSALKPSVRGGFEKQIIQDTGSGGSYPVSSDRVVWTLGANETLKFLSGKERQEFLEEIYPILCDTIEQDRRMIFDPETGLYRGEHSFLDWREQSYPGWTKDNVMAIAMSKAISVNAAVYFLLDTASEYSRLLKYPEREAKYRKWADDLREAINRELFDSKAGMYRTYLLGDDGSYDLPLARYDLLGESLAILVGVADPEQAKSIIRNYPAGPFGPPVVWPQERTVDVYHNQGIWPFVTAYWIKAARKAGNAEAVDAGIQSLYQLAALNLSNMENYDFVTGKAFADHGSRKGPVINSRRQLWSVAGYLSMVQDIVFGLETSWDGIRFQPFITAKLRNDLFGSSDTILLENLAYRGTRNTVRVHLPPVGSFSTGVCGVDRVELNGESVSGEFVEAESLKPSNTWDIYLQKPLEGEESSTIRVVDVTDQRALFAPVQPEWKDGVSVESDRVVLSFRHEDAENVTFNIYRDGQLCAQNVKDTRWVDPNSSDYRDTVHTYAVTAVDKQSGNVSHPTPSLSCREADQQQIIPAKAMRNRGGNLVGDHHFENWGKTEDELVIKGFRVDRSGDYHIRVEFANGSGAVNTGITCAVKRLEVLEEDSGKVVASGYLVMPQSGDWNRWDLSSMIDASLNHEVSYRLRIFEDEYSRNMSYLQKNERYTGGGAGGGGQCYNYVNIASVHLLYEGGVKD